VINLIASQSQIFKEILSFGSHSTGKRGNLPADEQLSDESDGDEDIQVGDG
jgi:hypothetical protein